FCRRGEVRLLRAERAVDRVGWRRGGSRVFQRGQGNEAEAGAGASEEVAAGGGEFVVRQDHGESSMFSRCQAEPGNALSCRLCLLLRCEWSWAKSVAVRRGGASRQCVPRPSWERGGWGQSTKTTSLVFISA